VIATVFPCYAPADRVAAEAIAAFLERGADVRVFLAEGEIAPQQTLADKAREARMAEIVLVLFSRDSLPPRWPRTEWEDALVNEPATEHVRIGFARLDDCSAPRVLRPAFDLAGLAVRGLRDLKRWVRDPEAPPSSAVPADLEVLGIALADRAGIETVDCSATAAGFIAAFRPDFDAVLRLDCGPRTLAALAGDLAEQLGLRLEGDLADNLHRLRGFCEPRRLLVVLADASEPHPELVFRGRCSTLISTAPDQRAVEPGTLAAVQGAFARQQASWTDRCALARQGRRLARDAGRMAEAYELMEAWHATAERLGDRAVLEESAREMVWILEGWGRTEEAASLDDRRAADWGDQMMLSF